MTGPLDDIDPGLKDSGGELHKLFSQLFPVNVQDKDGGRIQALIFISESGPLNKNKYMERLMNEFGLGSSQAVNNNLEDLEDLGLIKERGGEIQITQTGNTLLGALDIFLDEIVGQGSVQEGEKIVDQTHYNDVFINIYTDGDEYTDYFWIWELVNKEPRKISTMEYMVSSDGSPINLDLDYSKNIDNYNVTTDQDDLVIFDIKFKKPIQPEGKKKYWYSYHIDGNFDLDWHPWEFTYKSRSIPVKNLNVNIFNNKYINIKEETIDVMSELPNTKTPLGKFQISRLDTITTKMFNVLSLKARNVPIGGTLKLQWDFECERN